MGILKNTVIATTGTLPHSTKDIQRWIERNGGHYSASITERVTHLLASKEEYKRRSEAVQQATRLGIQVVSYDWFDDSLQARRQLGTKRYHWKVLSKERRVSKQLKKSGRQADSIQFRKGCKEIEDLTGSGTCDDGGGGRKPRKSKSFFFSSSLPSSSSFASSVPNTPFVSAKEDILRRRAERATAQEEADAKAEADADAEVGANATLGTRVKLQHPVIATSTTPRTTSNASSACPPSTSAQPTRGESQAKIRHWKDAYHYYRDVTGFEYKICLARSDFSCNGVTKYYVGLLETHVKPHSYWCIVQYRPAKKTTEKKSSSRVLDGHTDNYNGHGHGDDEEGEGEGEEKSPLTLAKDNNKNNLLPPSTSSPTHLLSLTTQPAPHPDTPYTGQLTPRTSAFAPALRAFRHAFRDLTLVPWESRFAASAAHVQKTRAQALDYEPFVYCRPPMGMPVGLFPQAEGVFAEKSGSGSGGVQGAKMAEDADADDYVRGALGFPLFERGLDANGGVGVVVVRERERERRRVLLLQEEEEQRESEERARRRREGGGVGRRGTLDNMDGGGKRPRGKRGNGVNGRGFVAPEFEHLLLAAERKR